MPAFCLQWVVCVGGGAGVGGWVGEGVSVWGGWIGDVCVCMWGGGACVSVGWCACIHACVYAYKRERERHRNRHRSRRERGKLHGTQKKTQSHLSPNLPQQLQALPEGSGQQMSPAPCGSL